MCADNYLIEVADLSEGRGSNPSALGLYLYDDISQFETRRLPEHRSEKAVDSVYSVVINMHNFHDECNLDAPCTTGLRAIIQTDASILCSVRHAADSALGV